MPIKRSDLFTPLLLSFSCCRCFVGTPVLGCPYYDIFGGRPVTAPTDSLLADLPMTKNTSTGYPVEVFFVFVSADYTESLTLSKVKIRKS